VLPLGWQENIWNMGGPKKECPNVWDPKAWDTRFLFSILWYSKTGNHPEEYLAKFHYRSDIKPLTFFWLPTKTQ
jgi:hypothetical protein